MFAAGLAALPASALAAGSLAGETIVIDPGHGGIDGGATAYGRIEKTVTLPIGLDLSALLRGAGARVVLTRSNDQYISLAKRVAIANAVGGDAFISIHANALSDPSYSGVTTFYGAASGFVTGVTRSPSLVAASRTLAGDVERATQARTGEIDRGVQSADYYVLGNNHMPTILVETGFITNPSEGQHLASPAYQESLAAGIADGLAEFAANPNRSVPIAPIPTTGAEPTTAGTEAYVVRPGDTLSTIAVHFGVDQAALQVANALDNANLIVAGRTLTVPSTTSPVLGTASSTAAAAPGGQRLQTYTIRPGDTLSAIAAHFGATEAALRTANALTNEDLIYAGQSLSIPDGAADTGASGAGSQRFMAAEEKSTPGEHAYVVKPGDTLTAIARRLGTSVDTIAQANGLENTDQLLAGQTLQLPGDSQTKTDSAVGPTQDIVANSERYHIRSGDTLSAIARRLGVSQQALATANQLSDLNHLVAGRYLEIPTAN